MIRTFLRRALLCLFALLLFNAALILCLRWIAPPVTMFMLTAPVTPVHHAWVPMRKISPQAALAVIASEDQRFPKHFGFDLTAIGRAAEYNMHHRHRLHGASTISQQTAKNLFLWRSRTYLRKALEAYFTVQLEALWGKRRILEVYLNSVQLGPDLYGVEAASERYFHKPAAQLTPHEAALLAAILPDPQHLHPDRPSAYVAARAGMIEAQMRKLGPAVLRDLR